MSRWGKGWRDLTEADIAALHGGKKPMRPEPATVLPKRARQHTEDAFVSTIIEMAHLYGWLAYHPLPSRTGQGYRTALQGDAGFVDLVLAKPDEPLLLWEAKSEVGRPTARQHDWLQALAQAREKRVMVVRPSQWAEIERLLRGRYGAGKSVQ